MGKNIELRNANFPLLMDLRVLATSSNEGRSDGSSAQQCFIKVKICGLTLPESTSFSAGR